MTDADISPIREFLDRLRNDQTSSLLARADELRSRLVKSAFLVFGIFVGCFAGARYLLEELRAPLMKALAVLPQARQGLHFSGPLDVFLCYVRVSFLVAIILSAPVLFMQAWGFLKPAFKPEDRRFVMPFFVAGMTLFIGGMAFCFFVMLPVALEFLIGSGQEVATPTIMIEEYVSMIVFMLLGFGAVFQLPLVMIILEALGLVTLEQLRKSRGFALVGILAVAAAVTPTPDPLSQIGMAGPMYILYECAILVIRMRRGKVAPA